MNEIKIRCPECGWRPDGKPHWHCSCGHSWNTFETAGRCPSCGREHHLTQCVRKAGGCQTLSRHEDWYEGLGHIMDEIGKEVVQIIENRSRASERE